MTGFPRLALSAFVGLCAATQMPAAAQTPTVQVPDTPAVAVVREFLADRTAGKSADAYALLSSASQKGMIENKFAAGQPLPAEALKHKTDPLFGLALLLGDTHNTLHYTYTLVGPDPRDPHTVLIQAVPPASATGVPPVTMRVVTVDDPTAHAPRLDVLASFRQDAPKVFAKADQNIKRTQSLNNLKQLGLGMIQYEQDNDEKAPNAAHWVDEIMPYVRSAAPFHDPSAPATQPYNYAYNRTLSQQTLAAMEDPAHTVMLFESTKVVKNASDTGQSVPVPGRHQGGADYKSGTDYLFADGHAQWFKDGTKLSFKLTGK